MVPKFCRICRLLLTLENAALKIDMDGNSKMTDKCKNCLIKIFEKLRERRKQAKKPKFFSDFKKKVKILFVKVGERLGRLET